MPSPWAQQPGDVLVASADSVSTVAVVDVAEHASRNVQRPIAYTPPTWSPPSSPAPSCRLREKALGSPNEDGERHTSASAAATALAATAASGLAALDAAVAAATTAARGGAFCAAPETLEALAKAREKLETREEEFSQRFGSQPPPPREQDEARLLGTVDQLQKKNASLEDALHKTLLRSASMEADNAELREFVGSLVGRIASLEGQLSSRSPPATSSTAPACAPPAHTTHTAHAATAAAHVAAPTSPTSTRTPTAPSASSTRVNSRDPLARPLGGGASAVGLAAAARGSQGHPAAAPSGGVVAGASALSNHGSGVPSSAQVRRGVRAVTGTGPGCSPRTSSHQRT